MQTNYLKHFAATLIAMLLPMTISAQTSGQCGDNLSWSFDTSTGTLFITGTGAMYDYTYSTVPWASYRDNITNVTINGGTSIGNHAFQSCSITTLTIPEGVTSIGKEAFSVCWLLESINLPSSLTNVGNYAFDTDTLRNVVVNNPTPISIPQNAFRAPQKCTLYVPVGSKAAYEAADYWKEFGSIVEVDGQCGDNLFWSFDTSTGTLFITGSGAMYDYSSVSQPWNITNAEIRSISLPSGLTRIGNYAFTRLVRLTSITIPSSVTSIGSYAFSYCSALTSITIPESVTSIESHAFHGCIDLASITIPSGVTSIGRNAFQRCSGLTSVTIPSRVTSIGEEVFSGCSGLTSVSIPESVTSIGQEAFSGCSGLTTLILPEGVTSIESHAFYYCTGLTSINIPESVTSVGGYEFQGCSSLSEPLYNSKLFVCLPQSYVGAYTIPSGIKTVCNSAFMNCTELTSLTIPSSVTSIEINATSGCTNLTSVTVGNPTPVSLSTYSFPYRANATLTVPYGSKAAYEAADYWKEFGTIEEMPSGQCGDNLSWALNTSTGQLSITGTGDMYDFASWSAQPWRSYYSSIQTVSLPDGLTRIGNFAFYNCADLTSVNIPSSVTSIGKFAFQRCSTLSSLTLPSGMTSIEESAFQQSGLTSIILPESMTTIGRNSFYNSGSLVSVTILADNPEIQSGAFNCSSLSSVCLQTSTPPTLTLNSNIFNNTSISNATLYVPKGSKPAYEAANVWKNFGTIEEMPGGKCGTNLYWAFNPVTGHLTITGSGAMYVNESIIFNPWYDYFGSITSVSLPDGLTRIADRAFYSCTGLTSVTIPESVTSIGEYAFTECTGLTEPVYNSKLFAYLPVSYQGTYAIPSGIETICGGAFAECSGLTAVTIPEGVTSMEEGAFYDCSGLTSVTIPEGMTSIGVQAFFDCSGLTSVTIPEGVTSIGGSAFSYCI